jgi:hypothetical protein
MAKSRRDQQLWEEVERRRRRGEWNKRAFRGVYFGGLRFGVLA